MTYAFLFTGSRDWPEEYSYQVIDTIHEEVLAMTSPGDVIYFRVGDCPTGVDSFIMDRETEQLTEQLLKKLPPNRTYIGRLYRADWANTYPSWKAGPKRNQRMVNDGANKCLAFIYGASRGTRNCANKAETAGISVRWVNHRS